MSAYIEKEIYGWTVIRTNELAKLERDKARLDWLQTQYEYRGSWDDFWEYSAGDLRQSIDKAQEAER
jgi:hypothetical protein